MTKVLVVHGSRHGGTRGIAERIGDVLRTEGAEAVVAAADQVAPDDVQAADAFIVGSGVYMGSWLKEPLAFMGSHAEILASHPTWLFSSGPLPGSSKEAPDADGHERARSGPRAWQRRTEEGRCRQREDPSTRSPGVPGSFRPQGRS